MVIVDIYKNYNIRSIGRFLFAIENGNPLTEVWQAGTLDDCHKKVDELTKGRV